MQTIRYGLVGAGYFGEALARALVQLPGASVTRVYDPEHGAAVARELGASVADRAEGVCTADDVDVVVVASPNWAHLEPVLAAARAGKHVFCEKPIALSYDDCAAMLAATREAGVLFMAGHVMNFMAGVRRAKQLINDGAIGDVLFCRALRVGWEEPRPEPSWKKIRHLSGGHLYHHIHELDFVQSIMGSPERATMVGGNVAHSGDGFGDEDDLLLITLQFPGNRYAAIEYGSAFRWPEHYVLIQGTLGAINVDLQNVGVTLRTARGSESMLLHRSEEEDDDRRRSYQATSEGGGVVYGHPGQSVPLWLEGIIHEELAYFHGLLQGGRPVEEFRPLTDGSAAAASIATADALTRSLAENRPVDLAEITG